MLRTWRAAMVTGLALSLAGACATPPDLTASRTHRAAGAGTAAGALVDRENRWRGAAVGTELGGVLNGTVTEISSRASRESLVANQRVAYQSTDGWQRVEVAPQALGGRPGCREVHERVYQDNQLVREQIREIC